MGSQVTPQIIIASVVGTQTLLGRKRCWGQKRLSRIKNTLPEKNLFTERKGSLSDGNRVELVRESNFTS